MFILYQLYHLCTKKNGRKRPKSTTNRPRSTIKQPKNVHLFAENTLNSLIISCVHRYIHLFDPQTSFYAPQSHFLVSALVSLVSIEHAFLVDLCSYFLGQNRILRTYKAYVQFIWYVHTPFSNFFRVVYSPLLKTYF